MDIDPHVPDVGEALDAEAVENSARGFRLPQQLAPFRHRNYSLFFFGQIISLTGTWMQQVAHGWLVLQLTDPSNRALVMGIVSAISALPILFLSLPAGLMADRFSKRNVLVTTQVGAMILALTLAGLTHWRIVTVQHIVAIGFLLGVVNAFDAPTRHSFVIEMVGREDLAGAIAMNSAMFNGARIIGPVVAGIVIAAVGLAGAFLMNGLSFIAVIGGLMLMRVPSFTPAARTSALQDLKEGLRFIRGHRMVASLLMLTTVVSIFGTSYTVLMPMFAHDVLHVGTVQFSHMWSSVGLGALLGAFTLSSLGDFRWKGKLLLAGNIVFCAMLMLFSFSRHIFTALPLLVGTGFGIMINMALTNTLIQTAVPDSLRGRVISVYTMLFLGMAPVGSMQVGAVAQWLGVPAAIRVGAVVCVFTALLLSPRFIHGSGG